MVVKTKEKEKNPVLIFNVLYETNKRQSKIEPFKFYFPYTRLTIIVWFYWRNFIVETKKRKKMF